MKKLFSALLVAVMMCSAFVMTAFAANPNPMHIDSPEIYNAAFEEENTSPQTGYPIGIGGVAAVALACGAVAIVSARKASRS